ncbi:protein neprosin-like [Aristolochia californica]|uniref:protein neprosin-like n=1 Tax=Aristolochia californica TaxID=171875 RepID=UPI0035E3A50C
MAGLGFACMILIWLMASLVISDAGRLSIDDFLAIEDQFRSLNKPAVKRLKTKYGDIFDCVDINKQPALDHPLLRNHSIQLRPTSFPQGMNIENTESSVSPMIRLPDGGCPHGTVPIKRTGIEEFVRAKSLGKRLHQRKDATGHHWAALRLTGGDFLGTEANFNSWAPKLANNGQYSRAQFRLSSGPYDAINAIEVGWIVSVALNKDDRPRLFVSWTADGNVRTGCYNLLCPGFVQVSSKIALGQVIEPVSAYNGAQQDVKLTVFKAPATGNWWVTFGESNELVGYWPKSIFTHLADVAHSIQWGGEVFNANSADPAPQMGSGHLANEGYGKAGYVRRVKIVDRNLNRVDAPTTASPFLDVPNCYNVVDGGNPGGDLARHFFFGGPGGRC